MMYGTKSSVTPANGSSSSNSIILRWPPDKPAVNSPAMVPPIFTPGLYDSFFLPPDSLSSLSEYSFQYGSCVGSNLGIFLTGTYGRSVWYCLMYVQLCSLCTSSRKVVLPEPLEPTTTVSVIGRFARTWYFR